LLAEVLVDTHTVVEGAQVDTELHQGYLLRHQQIMKLLLVQVLQVFLHSLHQHVKVVIQFFTTLLQ
jgi:hypothetical protein